MYSETSNSKVLVQDKIITQEDILKICEERENEPSIPFNEVYTEVLNYNPTI